MNFVMEQDKGNKFLLRNIRTNELKTLRLTGLLK